MGDSMSHRAPVAALGVVIGLLAAGPLAASPVAAAPTAAGTAAAAPGRQYPAWRVDTLPALQSSSRLVDVTATGPADAWAVGYQGSNYGGPRPERPYALLRWNGVDWSEQELPDNVNQLTGVSAATSTDVWTVGTTARLSPYAAHFDGTGWQSFHPFGSDQSVGLNDVAARGGRAILVGGDTGRALVMEWNGRKLAEVVVPGSDAWTGQLYGVTTAPGGATFAVGGWNVDGAAYPEPLIVQRSGSVWQVATLPKIPTARLSGVWARTATDAWAVGTIDFDSAPKPLVLHYDGVSWQRVTVPVAAGTLAAVAGDAAGNLWISGGNPVPPYIRYPGSLFLRYARGTWSTTYGPKVNDADPYLSALTKIPGSTAFWGVGAAYDPTAETRALIERVG